MVVTDKGVIIRLSLENISTLKRATQGVRLINLKENCTVATVATVVKDEEEESADSSEDAIEEVQTEE